MAATCCIQLTDLHLVPPGERLWGLDPAAGLAAAVASIAARHGPGSDAPADCVLVTGDLTEAGAPAAYALLREALAGLPCPWHLTLGNHDDRDAFAAAFPGQMTDGFAQSAIDAAGARVLLLDTLDPGSAAGVLCPARLAWLAASLAEDTRPVILALHHPPMLLGMPGMDRIPLRNPDALWAVLAPHAGRVRHLLHGHAHRPLAGSWRGIPTSSLRGTSHQVALDFGPGKARGSAEPPAYAVVIVTDDAVVVHSHDFLGPEPGFTFE